MGFNSDRKDGALVENLLANHLRCKGFHVNVTQNFFPDYDLEVKRSKEDTHSTTYEVKYDRRSNSTGNFAIEVGKVNKKGKRVPSGLFTTKSDYWTIAFKFRDNIFELQTFDTKVLKSYISEGSFKETRSGDGRRTICHIIKRTELKELIERVTYLMNNESNSEES